VGFLVSLDCEVDFREGERDKGAGLARIAVECWQGAPSRGTTL